MPSPDSRPRATALLVAVIVLAAGAILGRSPSRRAVGPVPVLASHGPRWWKGNTHAHTLRCGHADSTPEVVARWYLDHGYNFLVLSEHNEFIDPASVALPEHRRPDFMLVPGEELTGRVVHTSAFNVPALVDWRAPEGASVAEVISAHVARTAQAGGLAILNHPNLGWAVSADELRLSPTLGLLELWNGHPECRNRGDADHPSVEALWDGLLTGGRRVWAVASDDAHTFAEWGPAQSNAGRGWIMVAADTLTPAALQASIEAGRFYASNGVALERVEVGRRTVEVVADEANTARELASPRVCGHPGRGRPGWSLEAIGRDGALIARVDGPRARFEVPAGEPYLRVRASFARPIDDVSLDALGELALERFYAWTQPVFTDGRAQELRR